MKQIIEDWLQYSNYKEELADITDIKDLEDRFHQLLPFGTGGMRGKLGAGTNRINTHTIRLVAEGLARQIASQGELAKLRGVVIAYDTRHFSQQFAYETAGVLAAHGIQSYVFTESRPTPELSFAVRYLAAYAGVVITASHNPKEYNGFKVYGEDGAQLTPQFADEIVGHMNDVESIFAIESLAKEQLLESGLCVEILEKLDDAYAQALNRLQTEQTLTKDLAIVYTPLHGSGLVPIVRGLKDFGFTKVQVVAVQAIQDGAFPTVTYPNPEEADAFKLAIELGQSVNAELLLATDPDADRLGVAVLENEQYQLLTGNQLGALLLHYLLETKNFPTNAAMIKTIVTSEFGTAIANKYGIATVNTLTGFKYIAEKIAEWEQTGEHSFIFGYEESYGYLAGDFVRDKDAVQIALLTAEMAAFEKMRGKSLINRLNELYDEFGWYKEALVSFTFDGVEGQQQIAAIMTQFRQQPPTHFANCQVTKMEDYLAGNVNGLPKADVLKFYLADDSWICVRPSGTEPKCKIYIGVKKESLDDSERMIEALKQDLQHIVSSQTQVI
ncbi:phosphoglucomutase [Lysinibacillus sp. 2017]|uniref:phospho-sugar mutase n=1 Tax=unclassified Lysinibacillus TaxID=2636778 RepID=UPI000D527A27|nr:MULTISPECIES: phospho-sugar mutase [unclassified Lysinibacillus]AWE06408.1 phosphoglucomutase [Lysinibacillus sp. 2017]TGN33414.1 phospho-sugar mutase [Lysinibacillus sp. S2017]